MEKYYIKTGKENMLLESVEKLLRQTYWAKNRSIEIIEKSMEHSICYGIFLSKNDIQIGFARVVTDYATNYYICDVIVDKEYRGIGIGKILMDTIQDDKNISGLMGMLTTKDANGLYSKYGFKNSSTFMSKRRKNNIGEQKNGNN